MKTEPGASASSGGSVPRHYRLRGDVGGAERSYTLSPGENRIGSVSGNDIVLPVRGVSRRHAVLRLAEDALSIADLRSKNGVLVNAERVEQAPLRVGDEVRLGPVKLLLEELDAADAELAIVVRAPVAREGGFPSDQTTAASAPPGPRGWLRLAEDLLDRLSAPPPGDLTGALAVLSRELGAVGGCLCEWSAEHEPVLLAAYGQVNAFPSAFHDFVEAAHEPGREEPFAMASFDGDPILSCALLLEPEAAVLGVALWGDYRDRAESEPLLRILLRLVARLRARRARDVARPAPPVRGLVFPPAYVPGESPAMASLYRQMEPLRQGDLPVLILGETGVGKEYLARILHASSPRCAGPFVAINCAAIPADLLEAEMFGIGKGIATGVVERPGKFQLAQRGTLFLDEIGDMSASLQAKLLRALQEREVNPVGGGPTPVDIRVVAATNTDLHRRIDQGLFRRDLYYRLAGYSLHVPALRQRREDIPVLVEGFLRAFSEETGKTLRGMTAKALRTLIEYEWPGNIRELEHEVRRLVYLCPDGQAIESGMLSDQVRAAANAAGPGSIEEADTSLELEPRVHGLEERLIREALRRTDGNRTLAARLLGVSRNGLAIKMERLRIQA